MATKKKPPQGPSSAPVTAMTLASVNGILFLSDTMFSEHPDWAVMLHNTLGTKAYGEPCFRVEMTDGSPIHVDYPATPYTLVCALLWVYNPNVSNNIKISASFEFRATITQEPDYVTYQPLPRFVVTLTAL